MPSIALLEVAFGSSIRKARAEPGTVHRREAAML